MRFWMVLLGALVACKTNDADGDGYVLEVDCNDADENVHPEAPELCDGEDQDCDGEIDEDGTGGPTFYEDDDGDGFGTDDTVSACEAPDGYAAEGGDCDDLLDTINPGRDELCNTIDDNCDGEIDEATAKDAEDWWLDADSDGFGAGDAIKACELDGGVQNDDDCDDEDADVNPEGFEACDSVDNDCDGKADQDAPADYYEDGDGDDFGKPSTKTELCGAHDGWVTEGKDCDDTNSAVNPDATEVCNEIDDDCDDVIDPPTSADAQTWYPDADGDGVGFGEGFPACFPADAALTDGDCNDEDPHITPGEPDICSEGVDRNCDEVFDGCDVCHPFEPVSDVVWEKTFEVEIEGNTGSEVQEGLGAATASNGTAGYAMHTVLVAGTFSWDAKSYTSCDTNGTLLQVESAGTYTDPLVGTVEMVATNIPARPVLPKYDQVGTNATWSFDYDLEVESGFYPTAIPTVGSTVDDDLESVTVPAGTFMAWKVVSTYTADWTDAGGDLRSRVSTFWYVEGLGLVKELTIDPETDEVMISKELASYSGL